MSTHGLVLGKFLPPHRGHQYLIDFARNFVDRLTIVVGTLPDEPIPGTLRFQWMQSLFPNCHVVHLDKVLPQEPPRDERGILHFWTLWRESLKAMVPEPLDYVFASEMYGFRLAEEMGAQFIPVDIQREILPVSGTAIRENPTQHWQYLPELVRPYFLKRICVFGPESTGKSTLSRQLAMHFKTQLVPEYARAYLEAREGKLHETDMPHIARGQRASERALQGQAEGYLILDTDVWLTRVWSQFLYGKIHPEICQLAEEQPCDLYLLTDIDLEYEHDMVRYLPQQRAPFFEACSNLLEQNQLPYAVIKGNGEQRLTNALSAIQDHFTIPTA